MIKRNFCFVPEFCHFSNYIIMFAFRLLPQLDEKYMLKVEKPNYSPEGRLCD